MLGTKSTQLPVLIRVAHAAIDARLQQLASDSQDRTEERHAIADALAGLRVLEEESLIQ